MFSKTWLSIVAAVFFVHVAFGSSAFTDHNSPGPLGLDGAFDLVFSDDFSENQLSSENWTTCYWWDDNGCTNLGNKELQWYIPGNVSIENGLLVLTAKPENVIGYKGKPFPYTSGMVTSGRYYEEDLSQTRFATTYGFFEMRARIPSGKGLWPAFWLLPQNHTSKPEIDIMEALGHRPDVLEMHYHYKNASGESRNSGHELETGDLSKDWQVYGLEWSAEAITWYLNGEEMWRFEETALISNVPMYLIINLAVGGNWPGDPDDHTEFPAFMKVDYVRVWQRSVR
ncbi:MAG: glycoside hydrolase family 16 protein [Roseibium sp.]